jgi:hypothetical protein
MASVSNGQCKENVLQKDGTSVDITLRDVLYIQKLMMNLFSLTKENTGVALSSKGQIISLAVDSIKFSRIVHYLSLGLKSIPLQITLPPLFRLWKSMFYMICLAIPTLRYLQPLLLKMVSHNKMIFMITQTVPSAWQNRRIFTS